MIQDFITYIIIAVAVIIAGHKLFSGFLRKNIDVKMTKEKASGKQASFGAGCWQCSSKCLLYKECKDRL